MTSKFNVATEIFTNKVLSNGFTAHLAMYSLVMTNIHCYINQAYLYTLLAY